MVTQQYVRDIKTLTLQELQAKYRQKGNPGKPTIKDERSLTVLRRKYRNIDVEQLPESEGRLYKTWEVSAFNKETQEWETTTNHGYEYPQSEQAFEPATPAKITPSRRKIPERDHRRLFVFSDAQIDYRRHEDNSLHPIHDERVLRISQLICRDFQPDEIINCGDTLDLSVLSRFDRDSDHFHRTLGPSFQRVHDMYAEYRANNPQAKITEVDSNHNTRLKKFMLNNDNPFYGFKRPGEEDDYPVNTYPYLANLGHLNVNWVSGYGAAEYIYGEEYAKPPIVFKHGTSSVSSGSTAAKELNSETHVVRGHSHRAEMMFRTNRAGEYLASIVVGVSCSIEGDVPGVHSAIDDNNRVVRKVQNWQAGVLLIRDYNGEYEFTHVLVKDGIAHWEGKTYDGKEYRGEEQ